MHYILPLLVLRLALGTLLFGVKVLVSLLCMLLYWCLFCTVLVMRLLAFLIALCELVLRTGGRGL